MIKNFLLVAIGGGLGSVLRYGITLAATTWNLSNTIATFTANILGSFILGILMAYSSQSIYLFGIIGLCGGFTTFSTFSAQTWALLQSGRIGAALLYAIGSVLCSVLFVSLGFYMRKTLLS